MFTEELRMGTKQNKIIATENYKKFKLRTNISHDRFHRCGGTMATIKAHNLWQDEYLTSESDSVCTS